MERLLQFGGFIKVERLTRDQFPCDAAERSGERAEELALLRAEEAARGCRYGAILDLPEPVALVLATLEVGVEAPPVLEGHHGDDVRVGRARASEGVTQLELAGFKAETVASAGSAGRRLPARSESESARAESGSHAFDGLAHGLPEVKKDAHDVRQRKGRR